MAEAKLDPRLRAGRVMIIAMGVAFMVIGLVAATNPLPGEEEYLGRSFAQIRAADPQLGNIIWHDYAAFGILWFGASALIVYLAWRGLSRPSRQAWISIFILSATFLAFLIAAHVPVGNTSLGHFGVPVILAAILMIGVAIAAKPVFRNGIA